MDNISANNGAYENNSEGNLVNCHLNRGTPANRGVTWGPLDPKIWRGWPNRGKSQIHN